MASSERTPRRWWPAVKLLLSLLILAAVGWRFAQDLSRPELWERPLRLGWLVPAVVLYLAALTLSGLLWQRLLGWFGSPTGLYAALRAYHVSQLAKYIPGKAIALAVRVGMVREQGVPTLRAAGAAFYEVLTTMACGALIAAVLFLAAGPAGGGEGLGDLWHAVRNFTLPEEADLDGVTLAVLSLGLFALMAGPLLPPVVGLVNRVVGRVRHITPPPPPPPRSEEGEPEQSQPLAGCPPQAGFGSPSPFRGGGGGGGVASSGSPSPFGGGGGGGGVEARYSWLLTGLAITTPGWLMLGVALGCALQAIPGAEPDWGVASLARLVAVMGLSYVAGFVLIVPGGLGVREYLLTLVLVPDLIARGVDRPTARAVVVLAVLLLRVAWTLGEVLLVAAVYFVPPRRGLVCPN